MFLYSCGQDRPIYPNQLRESYILLHLIVLVRSVNNPCVSRLDMGRYEIFTHPLEAVLAICSWGLALSRAYDE